MSSAVVTGAARGFGLEIARRLLARGHSVVICDIDAAALGHAAEALGPGATTVPGDVRDPATHRRLAEEAAAHGPLEVWVNNAGLARAGKGWELPDEDVSAMLDANLGGVIHGSRAAVRAMRGRGGHILNIGSMSSLGPIPGLGVYAASKAGVLNFSSSLQGDLDLAGIPIRVHTFCPDAADTRLVRDAAPSADSAILFSNPKLLDPATVADRAVGLLDGRRIVATMPPARAALVRFAARWPSAGLPLLRIIRRLGERRRRRTAAA